MSDITDLTQPNPVTADEHDLKRVLGPVQLILLGIGGVIGAGIFVITGTAAAEHAGPAVLISFVIAALGCTFAGLCYAEFAAMIPESGSAYTYSYATLGRFMAWFIGWNLVLEYLVSGAAVAAGWSGYFQALLADMGMHLPAAIGNAPLTFNAGHQIVFTGALINLPAAGLILVLTALLTIGARESASFNGLMVIIKVAIVLAVIVFCIPYVNFDNLTPFIPANTGEYGQFGWSGIAAGAGMVFFAYIGFDAVSVAAQETKNPQRDLPIGILGSLLVCTILYILMALVMTGVVSYTELNVPNPVSFAVAAIGPQLAWLVPWINVGATLGLATVVFVSIYGQSRIFYAMARDGFLPPTFAAVHPQFKTPWRGTIITGLLAAVLAAIFPLDILGDLVSIGTLMAFIVVCVGTLIVRVRAPRAKRPFRTPFIWVVAPLGILTCGYMMYSLSDDTWVRLAIWTVLGLAIYFAYGIRHAAPSKWTVTNES